MDCNYNKYNGCGHCLIRSLEVFPTVLTSVISCSSISVEKGAAYNDCHGSILKTTPLDDDACEMSGLDYKSHLLNTLYSSK